MLTGLNVRNFKSLVDVSVELPQLAVFFGVNAAGKSNLLDAIQALSWIGNARTLFDALGGPLPVRGLAAEAFSFGSGGLPDLLRQRSASFSLQADLSTNNGRYRYCVEPKIDFRSGQLSIIDEYLAQLGVHGQPKQSPSPAIERVGSKLCVRRQGRQGRPREEDVGLNHSVLSDRSLSGAEYPWLEQVREELADWRACYLEPRLTMRAEESPADVLDIGTHGQYIAPFLYKLKAKRPKHFDAVFRALRSIVPSVEGLTVALDEHRGTLNLLIRQSGVDYSSRVLSEGTLRVLALCAVAVNPWGGSLVALEEPENGVHPRRLELIARLLLSIVEQPNRQIIVTSHSPLFVDAILEAGRGRSEVGVFNVRRLETGATAVEPFDDIGSLWRQSAIEQALESPSDDGAFEQLVLRGLLDE